MTSLSEPDIRKVAKAIEDERIKRKSLVDSWMEGAFSSQELHDMLNEEP